MRDFNLNDEMLMNLMDGIVLWEDEDGDEDRCEWSRCEGFESEEDFHRYINGGVGGLV